MAVDTFSILGMNGRVNNPVVKYSDGDLRPLSLGQTGGGVLTSQVHGKWFEAVKRGNVFLGNTVIAGVALPVNAATLVSKFTIWNLAGSGKDVELIEFGLGIDSATEVVNSVVLGVQPYVTSSGGVPGTLTQLTTPTNLSFSGQVPTARLYSAATLTNAAVLTNIMSLGINFDATAIGQGLSLYDFDGKVVIPPDTIATFMTTVVAETATFCSLVWAEWPQS